MRLRGKMLGMDRLADMVGSSAGPSAMHATYDDAMDIDDPKGLLSPQSSQSDKKKGWKYVYFLIVLTPADLTIWICSQVYEF